MSLNFQCPSCKRTLQFESSDSLFQVCRHCGGKIIVPSSVVHEEKLEQGAYPAPKAQRDFKLAEIQRELSAGRKIEAIKIFRETFGTDMKSAMDAVQAMQQNRNVDLPSAAQIQNPGQNFDFKNDKIYGSQAKTPVAPVRSRLFLVITIASIGIIIARCMGNG